MLSAAARGGPEVAAVLQDRYDRQNRGRWKPDAVDVGTGHTDRRITVQAGDRKRRSEQIEIVLAQAIQEMAAGGAVRQNHREHPSPSASGAGDLSLKFCCGPEVTKHG